MPFSPERRTLLKTATAAAAVGLTPAVAGAASAPKTARIDDWDTTRDRVILGGQFWANPMEDWRVADGWAECLSQGAARSVHLLTRRLADGSRPFAMSVELETVTLGRREGVCGFRIGVRADIDDHRAACFAGGGIAAGLRGNALVIGKKTRRLEAAPVDGPVTLSLAGRPRDGRCELTLTATDRSGVTTTFTADVDPDELPGNVALVHNLGVPGRNSKEGGLTRFRDWRVGGAAFSEHEDRRFGPILWTMYTLSDSRGDEGFVLKLTALTGPLADDGADRVMLDVDTGDGFREVAVGKPDPEAWTTTFRLPNWDETREARYRVRLEEPLARRDGAGGAVRTDSYAGTVRANPVGRPLRCGMLTCQHEYGFPYGPVADNLLRLDPDLLYFSGDQLYEGHGGYGIVRKPRDRAVLNYLRKYYQFGWAFRDAMRDRLTLVVPDDHDVFQPNIWGEGGMGYVWGWPKIDGLDAVPMVQVVHKTHASHHPDPYDPTPLSNGISTYYGELVFGDVGFALLADRMWKSDPVEVNSQSGQRPDHITDPTFDMSRLDKPGLQFLGERQLAFLRDWADDWRGHKLKIVLSETTFSAVATHHGKHDAFLFADLDSGGWPQTGRNEAVRAMSRPKLLPLHVNGDQHLATLTRYGADAPRDGSWSFCVPAIAANYQRWWRPDEIGMAHANRAVDGAPNTGDYVDSFGNHVYVHAVGNPPNGRVPGGLGRYERADYKMSGFGFVTVDTDALTYRLDAFRFACDATDGNPADQLPGWPVVIDAVTNEASPAS
ncbi:MAG: alkaline phosphatase D family protein [Planctomycetota bacterium]